MTFDLISATAVETLVSSRVNARKAVFIIWPPHISVPPLPVPAFVLPDPWNPADCGFSEGHGSFPAAVKEFINLLKQLVRQFAGFHIRNLQMRLDPLPRFLTNGLLIDCRRTFGRQCRRPGVGRCWRR